MVEKKNAGWTVTLLFVVVALLMSWWIVAMTPTPFTNLWLYAVVTVVALIIVGVFSSRYNWHNKRTYRFVQWSSLVLVVLPLFLASVAVWPNAPEETDSVQLMMLLFNAITAGTFIYGWTKARKVHSESKKATFFGWMFIVLFVILAGLTLFN